MSSDPTAGADSYVHRGNEIHRAIPTIRSLVESAFRFAVVLVGSHDAAAELVEEALADGMTSSAGTPPTTMPDMRVRLLMQVYEAYLDSQHSGPAPDVDPEPDGPDGPHRSDEAGEADDTDVAIDVLMSLPADLRALLVLTIVEELPVSSVATVTGLSEGSVVRRVARARQMFSLRVASL